MRRRSSPQRGFTLVEMMVVVAIVGILASLLFGAITRPVGANTRNVADKIISTLNFAKLRAAATRRIHRIRVQPTQLSIDVADATGLATPTFTATVPLQTVTMPAGIKIWDALAGATATAPSAENTSLDYLIYYRPDGQATASSIFITDSAENQKYRVRVYHATGGSYARPTW